MWTHQRQVWAGRRDQKVSAKMHRKCESEKIKTNSFPPHGPQSRTLPQPLCPLLPMATLTLKGGISVCLSTPSKGASEGREGPTLFCFSQALGIYFSTEIYRSSNNHVSTVSASILWPPPHSVPPALAHVCFFTFPSSTLKPSHSLFTSALQNSYEQSSFCSILQPRKPRVKERK